VDVPYSSLIFHSFLSDFDVLVPEWNSSAAERFDSEFHPMSVLTRYDSGFHEFHIQFK
jgi:poly-D-alanine transfer protein DltD